MAEDTSRGDREALHTRGSLRARWALGLCLQMLLPSAPAPAAGTLLQPWQAKDSGLHLGLTHTDIHLHRLAQSESALDVYPSKSPPVNSTIFQRTPRQSGGTLAPSPPEGLAAFC